MRLLRKVLPAALAAVVGLGAGPAPAEKGQGGGTVEVGQPAPDFTLSATQVDKAVAGKKGDTLGLKDLRGKNVVLFFFPKAMTGG